jgi:type II secretory ATPase GspE/PulE/Tfp pilus assembly ATPase PilB-like protein
MTTEDLPIAIEKVNFDFAPAEEALPLLIYYSLSLPASDFFITSLEDRVAISVRYMGIMRHLATCSREAGRRLVNHIKASAGMDVSPLRRPTDGRWVCSLVDGVKLDLRLNSIPTLHGEDLAVRLLRRGSDRYELPNLGLHRKDFNDLLALLNSPSGLLLVTGPTGSGKTTTLYACLHHLNDGKRKINTIEDPIEYELEGVRQSQINPKIDLDFPEMLRGVLRQAPDVIMIGEIRDSLTAETAVLAANSGHLVLATLHAPVAAAAVDGMAAFGVHPHFLASCLLGVMTQRLVRKLCESCRVSYDLSDSPSTFDDVRPWLEGDEGSKIYSAPGCERCFHEGYADRTGVFEVLRVTPEIRRLILERGSTAALRQKALEQGMLDLRRSALLKVVRGITSAEEVVRMIPTEHLMPE